MKSPDRLYKYIAGKLQQEKSAEQHLLSATAALVSIFAITPRAACCMLDGCCHPCQLGQALDRRGALVQLAEISFLVQWSYAE